VKRALAEESLVAVNDQIHALEVALEPLLKTRRKLTLELATEHRAPITEIARLLKVSHQRISHIVRSHA
jgi:DNA-directed RNA polymerase specialized sigma subunit